MIHSSYKCHQELCTTRQPPSPSRAIVSPVPHSAQVPGIRPKPVRAAISDGRHARRVTRSWPDACGHPPASI
ncbi:hypothetical protein ASPFODRAFT_39164 [Aspergillus luchuensis CBS 106.47]|uniref:Uncharacterized protein n=1 Tax=Aspergillus luchuensis (strain CBS 106.47) TaxID=1137211 RepID=A0A1M3TYY9_ASPLC|nr:hypothetical protein ASPFODRAFT_39164 [Aspergillus luchuensis CBS 106.47]